MTSINLSTPPQFVKRSGAPIGVRRLAGAQVKSCEQKNSVTGLYIGQSATLEIEGERRIFSKGALLGVERAVDAWVLKFRWDALEPLLSGASHTPAYLTWRQFAATLGAPTREAQRFHVPEETRPTWRRQKVTSYSVCYEIKQIS